MSVLLSAVCLPLLSGCLTNQAVGDHPKWRVMATTPQEKGLRGEKVEFHSTDGIPLTGWWLSADGPPRATVIATHGRAGNRSTILDRAAFLVRAGYDVLAVDLRAHGESGGNYMTPGYMEANDVLGAVDCARQRAPTQPIVLMGYSYSAVSVLHAAARSVEPVAVIADGAFITIVDLFQRSVDYVQADPGFSLNAKLSILLMRIPGILWVANLEFFLRTGVWLGSDEINALAAVRKIDRVPVLYIAGEKDTLAPVENARKLLDATPSPRKQLVVIPDVDHFTYTDKTKAEFEKAVLRFLDSVLEVQPTAPVTMDGLSERGLRSWRRGG